MSYEAPASTLPILLPPGARLRSQWTPTRHLEKPMPILKDPEQEEKEAATMEAAAQHGGFELMRNTKKVKPRRTIDYNGPMARWYLLRKTRPNPGYQPYIRPSPPHIIDLLPPKAYLDNPSTSLCTKFVHTSTNKIRCPVNVVTWTPEARRVLTGSTSGEFTLWNGLTFNFETILQAHDSPIRAFQFSHFGEYLISSDQSGVIKYFQPNMNNLAARQGHREAVRGLSFSPDDARFASCSDDSTIKLWAFDELREERTLTGHGWNVQCVQWHPTKGLLASGSKDNLVKFWDPRSGQNLSSLHYHKNTVQAMHWSPDGDMLATASRDQTVRVFDIRAMKELQVFKGHKKEVCSVAWHPIHRDLLISGGGEGSLIYWLLSDPNPRAMLDQAHDSNVWSIAWHPLGHLVCSGSNDHTARFWCRERPGDGASFRQGGEKPPDAAEGEDDFYVPGFGAQGGDQQDQFDDSNGIAAASGGYGEQRWGGANQNSSGDSFIPGFGGGGGGGGSGSGDGSSGGGGGGWGGGGRAPVAGRQSGPLPSQEELMLGGGGGSAGGFGSGRDDEWRDNDRGGGGFRGGGRGRGKRGWRDHDGSRY